MISAVGYLRNSVSCFATCRRYRLTMSPLILILERRDNRIYNHTVANHEDILSELLCERTTRGRGKSGDALCKFASKGKCILQCRFKNLTYNEERGVLKSQCRVLNPVKFEFATIREQRHRAANVV